MTTLETAVSIRPVTLEDIPAITALINAVDVDDIGRGVYTQDETRQDLTSSAADLPRSSWLAFEDERLVAYGLIWDDHGNERVDADLYVLRDHLPVGGRLLDMIADRAGRLVGARGNDRAVVHLHLTPTSPLRHGWMPDRGWRAIRTHHVLERTVSASEPVPVAPPGVTLRAVAGDADRRVLHRIMMASFAEHFDFHDETYDRWYVRMGGDALDWSLCWIASLDGRDVGGSVTHDQQADRGWVRSLGVLPAARGRGVARHLLLIACAAYAGRGRTLVGLGVDTENTTGAPRLYEGLGFTLDWAAQTWELEAPAG